jgi:cyclophilin family peptidyl-prolyl cis-trans isomerase
VPAASTQTSEPDIVKLRLFALIGSLIIAMTAATSNAGSLDPENTLYLDLDTGRVVIELLPKVAPKHVARVKELAREGFYDDIVFHRVIDGFMAQTGDPTGTGGGGSDGPDLEAEFSDTPYVRGTIGAARTSDPDSANSQFFITFQPAPFLNGQYTVWGKVVEGMEFVDKIARGEPPAVPDRIIKMQVAADAQ